MANRNSQGFGLIPQGVVGSTMASQGQGKYYISSNFASAFFQGSAVQSKVGYLAQSEDGRTKLTLGVFNGIFYNASTTLKPTWSNHYVANTVPANSEDITAFVIDNPLQLYAVGADAAWPQAGVGKTYGVTQATAAGSTTSGQSSKQLNIGNVDNAANTFRLLRSAEDPENNDKTAPNSTVIVTQNLNQYLQNTGTAGITWQ